MDSRTFYANAIKSGAGISVHIASVAVRDLEVEPGDQLQIIVLKTGKKGRRRPDAKFPKPETREAPAKT